MKNVRRKLVLRGTPLETLGMTSKVGREIFAKATVCLERTERERFLDEAKGREVLLLDGKGVEREEEKKRAGKER